MASLTDTRHVQPCSSSPHLPQNDSPGLRGCAEILLLYSVVVSTESWDNLYEQQAQGKTQVDAKESTTLCGQISVNCSMAQGLPIYSTLFTPKYRYSICICYLKKIDSKTAPQSHTKASPVSCDMGNFQKFVLAGNCFQYLTMCQEVKAFLPRWRAEE